jgi:hypothetical protein
MDDLPDHIASAFAIDVDFAASAMPTDRGVAIQRTQSSHYVRFAAAFQ